MFLWAWVLVLVKQDEFVLVLIILLNLGIFHSCKFDAHITALFVLDRLFCCVSMCDNLTVDR